MSMLDNLLGLKKVASEGDEVVARQRLNFVGDGITLTDNPLTGSTDITVLTGGLAVFATSLTSLVGAADKSRIDCAGYAAEGDGGGGTFVWYAGSTTPANGGTVFGSGSGRWKRVFSGDIIDPAWFGARGDGVTNDRVAMQAAIAALDTYAGLDLGNRDYYLGTRTGASDGALQLVLDGLVDKTLHSRGATIRVKTTNQVSGYSPVIFRILDCERLNFSGNWNFIDDKEWSTYDSYGETTTPMPSDWIGLSGAYAIWVTEGCSDITFGSMRFENTRYGIGITGIDGALPDDADRSQRISVAAIHAVDVQYPLLLSENGDDFSCPQLNAKNCMRAFDVYGANNIKISANIRNSISGFSSIITRKQRNTANVDVDLRYESTDGYPVTPMGVFLSPVAGTGAPIIDGVTIKITCEITTVDATREEQYAMRVGVYDDSVPAVETDYSTTSGSIRGLTLDIDKGKFAQYLDSSPFGASSISQRKIPVKLVCRQRSGGTYDSPIGGIDNSVYTKMKKFSFDAAPVYEHVSSDTVHATQVYPITGWGPWQDSGLANVSLANHTYHWRWIRNGALIHYEFFLKFGASGAYPAGSWYFRLPYPPDYAGEASPPRGEFGRVEFYDASLGHWYFGNLGFNGSSDYATVDFHQAVAGGVTGVYSSLTSTAPVTVSTNDTLRIVCDYAAYRAI